jgi:hypothetical protein
VHIPRLHFAHRFSLPMPAASLNHCLKSWDHYIPAGDRDSRQCEQRHRRAKEKMRNAGRIEAIRNGSVATWKHFNLRGEFDFPDERMVDSMGPVVPKNPGWKSNQNWEVPNWFKATPDVALKKTYGTLVSFV